MAVSDDFIDALQVALRAAELTDGAVDPTVGEALRVAGYDADFDVVKVRPSPRPRPRVRVTAARPADWRTVVLDEGSRTVMLPPQTSLDLGATAKALAADRAAQAAHSELGCGVLVNLGGDISLAGQAPPDGWRVRVSDDHRAARGDPGQTVAIAAGGLATSSTTVRRWRHQGRTSHHILDPRSGRPTDGAWRTVSVAAATCVDANTATTAALVRGAPALDWLSDIGLPARLVGRDGDVLAVGGWPVQAPC